MRKGVSCRAVYMLAVQVVARLRARHFGFRVQGSGCVNAVARLGAPHASSKSLKKDQGPCTHSQKSFSKVSRKTGGPARILKKSQKTLSSPPKDLKLSASCLNPNPKCQKT
jgi:hypothetical protein